jgi:hypothetical protein
LRAELDVTYRDYKKFQADSHVVDADSAQPLPTVTAH